jgi:hypothetical protein
MAEIHLITSDYQFGEKDVLDLSMSLSVQIATEDGHVADNRVGHRRCPDFSRPEG